MGQRGVCMWGDECYVGERPVATYTVRMALKFSSRLMLHVTMKRRVPEGGRILAAPSCPLV